MKYSNYSLFGVGAIILSPSVVFAAGKNCPVIGESCSSEGQKQCMGKNYAYCRGGTWLMRPCTGDKVCSEDEGFVFCDYVDGNGDGAECGESGGGETSIPVTTIPSQSTKSEIPPPEPTTTSGNEPVPPVTTSPTSTILTSSAPGPEPSNSCPALPGGACRGSSLICWGKQYLQCNIDKYIVRPCAPGTVCRTQGSSIVCDWTDSKGGTDGDNADCVRDHPFVRQATTNAVSHKRQIHKLKY